MSSKENQQQSELSLRMSGLVIKDNKVIQREKNTDQENRKVKEETRSRAVFLKDFRDIFIRDLNNFGICVIDSFLGQDLGELVYQEVLQLQNSGLFQEGQLVKNNEKNNSIRGDLTAWLTGNEERYPNIRKLITDIDRIVMTASKVPNNGKLGKYEIKERTKVMVACYPGKGAHYVKHVDNPHGDGRVITAIYYLNKDWNRKTDGGVLRIFPTDERNHAADIDPMFDRMLFFWSDKSNPHEVQPSYRTRYAITIWYYDVRQKSESVKFRQKQASQRTEETNENQNKRTTDGS
ncbi:prolyl hydroxylase EGLN3-like [Planococcus citri]|uniref:prolyl hydroxylase EGLN3-like n=1 Tax=Planococcus citri TaxID=170843 RepID=UPI0031F9DC68